ncbi:MAG: preprotein translocase subunit SecG [Candidatus Gracilibacteria bacterium]|nr:preprotein translocase subunit SecG [Candidatus Gracilibacteria bacterium]
METILTISQIIISVLLIIIILIQNKNVSLNLTSMGGGMGSITKRGGEKVLHITTIILGTLFTLNSLLFFFIK